MYYQLLYICGVLCGKFSKLWGVNTKCEAQVLHRGVKYKSHPHFCKTSTVVKNYLHQNYSAEMFLMQIRANLLTPLEPVMYCCCTAVTVTSLVIAAVQLLKKNIVGPKKAKLTCTRMMGRNRLWSEALQITCASCHWNWVTTLPRFSQTNHLFTFKHWIKAEGLQWNMNEWLEMYISRLMCSFFIPTLSIGYFRNPYKGKILTETWMNAQRIRQFCFIIWLFVIRSNAQVQSLTWIPLSFMSESSVLVFQQVIQNALTHVQATRHVEEPWGTDETATLPLC